MSLMDFKMPARHPDYGAQYANQKIVAYTVSTHGRDERFEHLTHQEARAKWHKLDAKDIDAILLPEYALCPECKTPLQYGFFPGVGNAHPDYEASLHCPYCK